MKRKSVTVCLLLALLILLCACQTNIKPVKSSADELRSVALVNEKAVSYEEVRYLTLNFKKDMALKYGEGIWDDTVSAEKYRNELESKVFDAMKKYPVLSEMLEKYGIDVSDKEISEYVKSYINDFADSLGGKDEYLRQLDENGMTDHYLRYMLSLEACREKLRQALCTDKAIDDSDRAARAAIKSDEFIRTLHIYISNDNGDDIEENRRRAEEALALLDAGEKLTTLIGRYSEDFYMTTTDGYYFTRGEYEKAYEDAAFALSVGDHSGVVEGETGFYIIMRLEKDENYIEKNFDTLKEQYLYVQFDNILSEAEKNAVITLTEYGKTLDILKIN
ncbi:MAG: SurA N-terminal domain-containing protein [Eubacteriales bacterium]